MPNNPFTETVFSRLKKGQTVNIEGPKGHFVLQEYSTRPTLFLAYSHGFAPIKSLVEHATSLDMVAAFHLYWIIPADGEHYQSNQCRAWADALDNFQYTPLTAESDEETQLKPALAQVVADYPALNDFEVYLAGTDSFVTVAEALLRQHQLPDSQCHLATVI